MILNTLFSDPMMFIAWFCAIIIALTIHEFSHALTAYLLGDHTAKSMGRVTLNPLAHISGMGLIMLILVGFGWGKPVPFNPYNFRRIKLDAVLVALAGPFSNLVVALVAGVTLRALVFQGVLMPENLLIQFLNILIIINSVLMIFNLIPIPPLDGSKLLFAFLQNSRYSHLATVLENQGPFILIALLILDNVAHINIFGGIFTWMIDMVYRLVF
jgi:Zn-dependent protease